MEYWDQVLRAEDSINQGMFVFILIMIFFISWLLTLNRNLLMIMNMIYHKKQSQKKMKTMLLEQGDALPGQPWFDES